MDSWEIFHGTELSSKEKFYSCLNIKNITDTNYRHATRVFREFEINNFR